MDGEEINPRNFDALVELVAPSKHDVIIDNGASSFVQLAHYLVTNEVPQLLQGMGHELVIHLEQVGAEDDLILRAKRTMLLDAAAVDPGAGKLAEVLDEQTALGTENAGMFAPDAPA